MKKEILSGKYEACPPETLMKVRPPDAHIPMHMPSGSGYPLQVLARSSLWAFRFYPWPMPVRHFLLPHSLCKKKNNYVNFNKAAKRIEVLKIKFRFKL
ncbi:MAG: hypothetical protein ACKVOQ_05875 [Cyclobacteriaceae bacterium]